MEITSYTNTRIERELAKKLDKSLYEEQFRNLASQEWVSSQIAGISNIDEIQAEVKRIQEEQAKLSGSELSSLENRIMDIVNGKLDASEVAFNVTGGKVVQRASSGHIMVPQGPGHDSYAASKKYVDDGDSKLQTQINTKVDKEDYETGMGAKAAIEWVERQLAQKADKTHVDSELGAVNLTWSSIEGRPNTSSNPEAGTLVERNSQGRFHVLEPIHRNDPTNKEYVDKKATWNNLSGRPDFHATPTPGTLMYRNSSGRAQVTKGYADQDIANMENVKEYVRVQIQNKSDVEATRGSYVIRDTRGGIRIPLTPLNDNDAISKKYVDDRVSRAETSAKTYADQRFVTNADFNDRVAAIPTTTNWSDIYGKPRMAPNALNNALIQRDDAGHFYVHYTPSHDQHPASKAYVDNQIRQNESGFEVEVVGSIPANPKENTLYLLRS